MANQGLPFGKPVAKKYQLVELLGSGGMGDVYKAHDMVLNRVVAMKVMKPMPGVDAQQLTHSFRIEAQRLASLKHTSIPHIYDYFEEAPHWFLVMEFIEGETLNNYLKRHGGRLPVDDVLKIGLQLANVLNYLHQHQQPIIFRDLKPANVMISANGQIFLIDFGIARVFTPGKSQDTFVALSRGYAAPEQHGSAQTTVRSDIYSLGATLHHLLSGTHPASNPFLFASLSIQQPTQLASLIAQMVALDPTNRPTSMAEVKNTLQYMIDQISALVAKLMEQGKFEKNPVKAVEAYDQVLALHPNNTKALWGKAVLLTYSLATPENALPLYDQILSVNPQDRDALAEKANVLHILGRYEEEIQIYDQLIARDQTNQHLVQERDALLSQWEEFKKLLQHENLNPHDPLPSFVWMSQLVDLGKQDEARHLYEIANKIVAQPDSVSLYRIKALEALSKLGKSEEVLHIIDNVYKLIRKWEADKLYELANTIDKQKASERSTLLHKAEELSELGKSEEAFDIIEKVFGLLHKEYRAGRGILYEYQRGMKYGSYYAAGHDRPLRLRATKLQALTLKAKVLHKMKQFMEEVQTERVLHYEQSFFEGSGRLESEDEYFAREYSLLRGALKDYDDEISLNPQNSDLLNGRNLVLHELEKKLQPIEEAIRLNPNDSEVLRRKGEILELYGRDEEAQEAYARAKELEQPGTTIEIYRGHSHRVSCIAWSPDGTKIASVEEELRVHTVHVWEIATGKRLIEHQVYRGNSVAWSPDGQFIASGICNGTPYVWEATTGKPITQYDVRHGYIIHEANIAWSLDGQFIAFGTGGNTVHLWEAATGKLITHYEGTFKDVYSVAWSPDGQFIALGGPHRVEVLEYHSEKLIANSIKFDDAYGAQRSIVWSPDGEFIASGSGNFPRFLQEDSYNTAQVWEAATGKLITQYTGHASSVNSVAWSPDGKYIASGSYDQTVQVWEAVTGNKVVEYKGHSGDDAIVTSVAWSPDGTKIASASMDKTVHVWVAPQ